MISTSERREEHLFAGQNTHKVNLALGPSVEKLCSKNKIFVVLCHFGETSYLLVSLHPFRLSHFKKLFWGDVYWGPVKSAVDTLKIGTLLASNP